MKENELLAQFLGWEFQNDHWFAKNIGSFKSHELKFHYDWNELMKVLDKIRSYQTLKDIQEGSISIERFEMKKNSMCLSFYKYVNGKGTLGNSYHAYFPDHKEASDSESYIEMVFKCCVDFVKFING